MSMRFWQYPCLTYSTHLICMILTGCASSSSQLQKETKPDELQQTKELVVKLQDKVLELETRLTALNEKISLEEAEKAAPPVQKIQTPPAAKISAIPAPSKPQASKFAESFKNDEASDRFREARILFDSGRNSDAILEFSDFVKTYPDHVLTPNAQHLIGMSYLEQKEYKLAEEELSRVLINHPHSNAIPDTLLALVKVSEALNKPARVTYFREKLMTHFPHSPQSKKLGQLPIKEETKTEATEVSKAAVETPAHPEPPTAPAPEMGEPSVVKQ